MINDQILVETLKEIGNVVCKKVHDSIRNQSVEYRSSIYSEGQDDTIYQIDRDVEEVIVPILEKYAKQLGGLVVIAEGIGEETALILPKGIAAEEAKVRIIIDPIDGTRGIMYDKRSAFFLAAAAPNKGDSTSLNDIEIALMTELPTSRSIYSDTLWAIKGKGAYATTTNLLTSEITSKEIRPSKAKSISQGFGQLARFFPPGRDIIAAIEDEMLAEIFPNAQEGKAITFEDQYISSGGQLYEVLVGHDRYIGDIRATLYKKFQREGKKAGHVCHPYDVCTILIGQEAGLIITDIKGNPLDIQLDTTSAVDWIAYANEHIRNEVEPVLQKTLKKFGLL